MRSYFSRAIYSNDVPRLIQAARGSTLLFLCALAMTLSGCSASAAGGNPAATMTAGARVTQVIQPLVVALTVSQRGTLAARNVQLNIAVTITNNTSTVVAITDVGCPYPTIVTELRDPAGSALWHNYAPYVSCPYFATLPHDTWTILAGASVSEPLTADLYVPSMSSQWIGSAGPYVLRAGVTYTLVASVLQWHQGPLADIGKPGQGRNVSGQATIVFD